MKNTVVLSLVLLICGIACKEKPLVIPESTTGKRKVLVEEITGVNCPNCPNGTAELTGLQAQYGENLVVVSIHGGDRGGFNQQLPGSRYNFNTDPVEALANTVGQPAAFPTAAINRQLFDGLTEFYTDRPWKSYIEREAQQDFGVYMILENQYDPATRLLNAKVDISPEKSLNEPINITAYIIEDSIHDVQNVFGELVPDYLHRHVLRELLTPVGGSPILESLAAGTTVTKTYSFTLPADFEAKHCSVVAFIHHSGQPDKEVLQVAEKHIE